MTTPIVPSISDELIEELEAIQHDASFVTRETDSQEYLGNLAGRTLARLRAAEADVERRGKALSEIITQVDLNIRPTVRDIINGMPDANDIYGYCDAIDRIALAAMERTP